MDNEKIVKQYFNKYFKAQYFKEDDHEFKSLVRILNKKDKQVKNLSLGGDCVPVCDCCDNEAEFLFCDTCFDIEKDRLETGR